MNNKFNPAKYGLTLQRLICDFYNLEENELATKQFNANFDEDFVTELHQIIEQIEHITGSRPIKLLTFTNAMTAAKQSTCPHNFLLANGKTLSLRTTIGSGKVAPRTVGQAGFSILNKYFSEVFDEQVEDQRHVREKMYANIHKVLPIFIECFFPSDYNILIEKGKKSENLPSLSVYKLSEIADYSFNREEFTFTRDLNSWVESTTLKYHDVSIAELQTHKNRTFKFRFIIKAIPEWYRILKETNETLGITAEAAICDVFKLEKPISFGTRVSNSIRTQLIPIVKEAFKILPKAVKHTGSEPGERGQASKCSFDFVLDYGEKLSLKTNTGKYVCPPEVGQPGAATCLSYFKEFLPEGVEEVNNEVFKQMVFDKVEQLIPIYLTHLFDSDWLLWIYKAGNSFKFDVIHKKEINNDFVWKRENFTFTKPSIAEWNESNTVKYNGKTIGEFQVHHHRTCFKFRFNMPNVLEFIRNR